MKKVIAIVAIATSLVACGGGASTAPTTDSTAVTADSTVKADTAVAPTVDTTKVIATK